jgi:hypothetical protein
MQGDQMIDILIIVLEPKLSGIEYIYIAPMQHPDNTLSHLRAGSVSIVNLSSLISYTHSHAVV